MSVSIDTNECFWGKIGERYSFKEKLDSQHENPILAELSVNEVMETIMAGKNDPSTWDPTGNVTDKDNLRDCSRLFSSLMSTVSD